MAPLQALPEFRPDLALASPPSSLEATFSLRWEEPGTVIWCGIKHLAGEPSERFGDAGNCLDIRFSPARSGEPSVDEWLCFLQAAGYLACPLTCCPAERPQACRSRSSNPHLSLEPLQWARAACLPKMKARGLAPGLCLAHADRDGGSFIYLRSSSQAAPAVTASLGRCFIPR